jgi:type I restriction enzyme, S subunit
MKAGWKKYRIGDLLEVQNGFAFDAKAFASKGTMPLIRIRDLKNGKDTVTRFSGNYDPKYVVRSGDFLVGMDGEFGCFEWKGPPALLNQRVCRLQNFSAKLYSRFLFYGINSYLKDIEEVTGFTTVKHLSSKQILGIEFLLPPLSEQQRIVAILDEAFDGIATARANAEQNLRNARALFESHLQTVFTRRGTGWSEAPLVDLCDIKHGFAFKSEFFATKGDYVLLTPGSFFETGGYRERGEKQKYYCGDIPSGFILKKGDLLVAMTEQAAGLLGSSLLVPESDKFLHNQRLGLVTCKPNIPWANEFFFYVFNTRSVRKAIHNSASGVKVRHTSPTKIGEVIVTFPSAVTEQLAIVSEFKNLQEETHRLESIYQRKLAALDELKKSLLAQAFSGQL